MTTLPNDEVEPPYGVMWRGLSRGEVVPFLGAGASLVPRDGDARFDGNNPKFLPNGAELSEWLARQVRFPEMPATDLAKVASYFQVRTSRDELTEYLRGIFQADYPCSPIHELLADIPHAMLIITTNYDDLIERAFRARSKPFHLVTYPDEDSERAASNLWWKPDATEPMISTPADLPLEVADVSVIYKMHGSVIKTPEGPQSSSFVITEEDYVRFLSRMTLKGGVIPARFLLHLRNSALLFLGYGLRDWNFRVMLEKLRHPAGESLDEAGGRRLLPRTRANEKPAWAIQKRPSPLERILWESRNVQIFDQDLTSYAAGIRSEMPQ